MDCAAPRSRPAKRHECLRINWRGRGRQPAGPHTHKHTPGCQRAGEMAGQGLRYQMLPNGRRTTRGRRNAWARCKRWRCSLVVRRSGELLLVFAGRLGPCHPCGDLSSVVGASCFRKKNAFRPARAQHAHSRSLSLQAASLFFVCSIQDMLALYDGMTRPRERALDCASVNPRFLHIRGLHGRELGDNLSSDIDPQALVPAG
jgi:hypothetical protein